MTPEEVYETLYGPNGLNNDLFRPVGRLSLKEIIAVMQDEVNKRHNELQNKGGMSVPNHGSLCNAPPSTLKSIQRWIDMLEKHI